MTGTTLTSDGSAGIDWWAMLTDRAFLENPYPELRRLQELGPVHLDAASGVYFVLGHDAFSRLVKSSGMGRDPRNWAGGWDTEDYRRDDPVGHCLYSEFQPQMINVDGADHARMRRVYDPAFRSQSMQALVPMIEGVAARLLDAMPRDGEIDFIEAYARPLPLRVLCELFDIPGSFDDTVGRWSEALIRIGDIMITPAQKQDALEALTQFKEFLRRQVAERRQAPGDSLLDLAVRANDDGTLDDDETLTNLVAMLIAGHETTVTLIGNGMMLLLNDPGSMARLRADRSLMRTAVEEFLRYEPGGNMILRVAHEDVELGGTTIPAGAAAIGMVGAINRDPARFEHADEFDVARTGNAHFTFGGGPHFCVGAPLARLEAHIAFSAMLDRYGSIEPDGKPEWRLDRLNARGLARLPVRVGDAP